MFFIGFKVEAAQEFDRFEILASAVLVGNPFSLFAGIVEIEHGGDRIYPQAVDVVALEPEHGARHQEAADFGAAVIENERLPIRMETLARIRMFVKVRAVEVGEAVRVGWEVRRNPVENHTDVLLVQVVHQVHEILRRAVAGSGSEVARGLVSPLAIEGVLHEGQELDVSKAQLARVLSKAGSNLAIGQWTIVLFGDTHPGTHVDFIHRHGRVQRVALGAFAEPVGVIPRGLEIPNDRGRSGRLLVQKSDRVRFVHPVAVVIGDDMKLVYRSFSGAGNKAFPNARTAARLERMRTVVPPIEASDHVHISRIGRPYAEDRTLYAL